MTGPVCEWCSAPLNERQIVACSTSCRLKRWRWLNGIPLSPSLGIERPPEGSVLLDGVRAVRTAEDGSDGSRVSNGGLQVSFRRAVAVLAGPPLWLPDTIAERELAKALSDAQRARFEGRAA